MKRSRYDGIGTGLNKLTPNGRQKGWILVRVAILLFLVSALKSNAQDDKLLFTKAPERTMPFVASFPIDDSLFLEKMETTPAGALVFPNSGFYRFEMEAYCLELGDKAPAENTPFTFSQISGKYAEMVTTILANSWKHPEIERNDIQRLVWALSANITIKDLPEDLQGVANVLIDKKGKKLLARNAIAGFAKAVGERIYDELPVDIRDFVSAQENVRAIVQDAEASYEDWQSAAVSLSASSEAAPIDTAVLRQWTYLSEEGIYARIFPKSFSSALLEIYVPEFITIERDSRGRITSESDWKGNRIETEYDDSILPKDLPDVLNVKAYAFKRIIFSQPDPDKNGHIRSYVLDNNGWVFAKTESVAINNSGKSANLPHVRFFSDAGDPFKGFFDRAEKAKGYYDEAKKWSDRLEREGRKPSWKDIDAITDEKHYEDGLDAASKGMSEKVDWVANHALLTRKAWMYSNCVLSGKCAPPTEAEMNKEKKGKPKELKPFEKSVAPKKSGDSDQQSLGIGRPK